MKTDGRRCGIAMCVILTAVTMVIAGCGGDGGSGPMGDAETPVAAEGPNAAPETAVAAEPAEIDLVGAWLLEDLGGRGVVDMVRTTLEFESDGIVSGRGGCNRFTGSYDFEEGKLEFGPLAVTKMMCPEAVMEQEDGFHRALGAVDRVEMDGPFLLIYTEGLDQPLRFTRTEQEVEL